MFKAHFAVKALCPSLPEIEAHQLLADWDDALL